MIFFWTLWTLLVLVWLHNHWIPPACLWLCRTFPSRSRVVPKADEPSVDLLLQFMIWPGRLYLQHFIHPETGGYFHRHRWSFMRSLVLSGYFIEQRPIGRCSVRWVEHVSPSIYSMDHNTIHRVAFWSEDCWTLFYMSKERTDLWGYYKRLPNGCLSTMIPWRAAVMCRVPSLETKEITR